MASKFAFTKEIVINLEDEQWDEFHGHAYARGYFLRYVKILDIRQNEMLIAFNIEY